MYRKSFFTCLFFVLILSLMPSYGDTNVLTNPGFESGTTGWSGRSCSISTVSSPVYNGSQSGRAYNRHDFWQGIKQDMIGKMVPGETYQISGWVRISDPTSRTVKETFEQRDGNGTRYIPVDSVTANNSSWVQLSGDFTLNVTGTLSVLDVYFEGPPEGVDIYVDDAVVYGPGSGDANATGQIDINTRHQEIEGFGASGAWYTGTLVNHPQRNTLYDLLFNQLGLDIYRIRNTYEIESGTFNDSVTIAQQGQAALVRPLKIMISSWSPPAYLKSNDSTVRGTLKKSGGNYMYTEFAQWWYNSIAAYAAQGIVADYINIQNEPDWEANWDTCLFDPTENSTNAGYDSAFEAVWQKLNTEMGSSMPKMLASEATGLDSIGNYINNLDNLSHVYGYAHHLYNCSGDGDDEAGCGSDPDRYLSSMTSFNSQYGDRPLFQTEYEYLATSWTDAMNTALLLHNSLTVEEVTSYLYWELFWGSGSGLISLSSTSYTINPVYYGFKHYSAFINSGWQRVDASTDSSDLRISAYISPDNQELSVVIVNTSTSTSIEADLSFADFSTASGSIYRSSQTENCALVGSFDGTGPLAVPANSITTLALTGTPIPSDCQQVQDLGLRLPADLDGNCHIDYADMLVLTDQWLSTDPVAIPPYYSPDIYTDGKIDLLDLCYIANSWLLSNDPEDPN